MKTDKGFGLIMAVFVILILSLLILFSTSMFSSDIEIALDSLRSTQALFLCEGALNYCIKHELINDPDWSDNTDTINKPLGRGVFSIYYDPNQTTTTQTTVHVTATVDDITRQITRSFQAEGWPDESADFPYSLYTSADLSITKSTGISIETPYETNNSSVQHINCDFGYYAGIADTTMSTDWILSNVSGQVYTGIIYVNGMVEWTKCNNMTVNGTIIATGDITISGCDGITIAPSGNYPALVSGTAIKTQKSGGTKNRNLDIRGMAFSGGYISISDVQILFMTGILYSVQNIQIKNTDDFRSDASIIAQSSITFDTCYGTGPDINWGSRVLDEPPGFTWGGGGIIMGAWEEVY
ncbi:MAG: hypothetical protein ACMUHX_11295 [bacterium]